MASVNLWGGGGTSISSLAGRDVSQRKTGTYDTTQQEHGMAMDILDRQNAMSIMQKLMGYGGVDGSSSSASGMGLPDAESRLATLLDDPESIKQTGAYKFRLGQGQEALERSLGAKGMLGSGNRLTELTKYGQDMASQEYENQFGRLSDLLGRYQTAKSNTIGSLAGVLGSGAIGRGGTDAIWGAYSQPRTAAVSGQYGVDRAAVDAYGNRPTSGGGVGFSSRPAYGAPLMQSVMGRY